MTIEEINKLPMVFIVGMGRSGTTLLRTILDANEEILFAPEGKIIVALKQKYKHKTIWTPDLLNEFIIDLYKDVVFNKWGISKDDLLNKFLSYPSEKINFSFLLKIIYLSFPSPYPKKNIQILGDKNPINSIFIKELLEVFPDAKFIHLVRDYRDCILSNRKLFKRQNIYALSQLWKIYNSWISVYSNKYPKKFLLVRYEDFIDNPEKCMTEICEFIGLTFESRMLNFYEVMNNEGLKKHKEIIEYTHPNLLNKVNKDSLSKWKTEFSLEEQEKIAFILENYGLTYGYDKNPNYTGRKYRLFSIIGFWVNIKDFFIIKGYYLLPFSIRDFFRKITRFLFEKTGWYTVYNQVDLISEMVEKKNKKSGF